MLTDTKVNANSVNEIKLSPELAATNRKFKVGLLTQNQVLAHKQGPLTEFFQNIFDPTYATYIPPELCAYIPMSDVCPAVDKKGNFFIGAYIISHITTTHHFLSFIKQESIRPKVLLRRSRALLCTLCMFFRGIYKLDIPANILPTLERYLFLSTQLSFEKEASKRYQHKYNIVGAYWKHASLAWLHAHLKYNRHFFYRVLEENLYRDLSREDKTASKQDLEKFYATIEREYHDTTVPNISKTSVGIGLLMVLIIVIACVKHYGFDIPVFPTAVFALAGFLITERFTREYYSPRSLAEGKRKSYLNTLAINAKKCEVSEREMLSSKERNSPNRRAEFSVWCELTSLQKGMWRRTSLPTDFDSALQEMRLPLRVLTYAGDNDPNPTDDTFQHALLNYEQAKNSSSDNSTTSIGDKQQSKRPHIKRELGKYSKEIKEDNDAKLAEKKAKTTSQISRLPNELAEKGLLVTDSSGARFAFFEYGKHQSVIEGYVKPDKRPYGIFWNGLLGPRGQFNGFKSLSNNPSHKQWEYKPPRSDHARYLFQETGSTNISDDSGIMHVVPYCRPL